MKSIYQAENMIKNKRIWNNENDQNEYSSTIKIRNNSLNKNEITSAAGKYRKEKY